MLPCGFCGRSCLIADMFSRCDDQGSNREASTRPGDLCDRCCTVCLALRVLTVPIELPRCVLLNVQARVPDETYLETTLPPP